MRSIFVLQLIITYIKVIKSPKYLVMETECPNKLVSQIKFVH
jgi:hypothetical protein